MKLLLAKSAGSEGVIRVKVIALDEAGQGDIVIDELEVTVLPPPRS